MTGHAVVVLAAGCSQRLGQPKQLLRAGGETLLRRSVRLAVETSPDTLVVVLPQHPRFEEELHGLPAQWLRNPNPGLGVGGSLSLAATHVYSAARVLVMICDQPMLRVDHLRALLGAAAAAPSGCAATVLCDTIGVPAVVPGTWFAGTGLEAAGGGFGQRLRQTKGIARCSGAGLECDIDTPEDLRRARELGWLDPASA
ncbi:MULTISPECIES: nucleotidyltransferase family protein [unclassified Stenotrophomonas]|uniref:nucleotidyltransferase family protein n=1 Tax=unclassified Stenotrophomonas TaxID=196198 RepID=UPI003F960B6B